MRLVWLVIWCHTLANKNIKPICCILFSWKKKMIVLLVFWIYSSIAPNGLNVLKYTLVMMTGVW
jgi:hypothetical protein